MKAENVTWDEGRERQGKIVLQVRDLRKNFPAPGGQEIQALKGVSFDLPLGGLLALVGPDGAGKTTLLRILSGLMKPDAGQLSFSNGKEDLSDRPESRNLGYMPQKFGLYEDLTVRENMDLYADLGGLPQGERAARYAELLALTGMSPFVDRLAGKLSGGMKQKLGLMCTLVTPPHILLLDEPTVGVDPLSRRELWGIVDQLALKENMSVIVSTSYLDEAEKCDEMILLHKGEVLAQGSPKEIHRISEGFSYMVNPGKGMDARTLRTRLAEIPGVMDVVPEGGQIRLVHGELKAGEEGRLRDVLGASQVTPVPSTLEDSFMLLLKSGGHGDGGGDYVFEEPQESEKDREEPVIETHGVYKCFGDFIAVNNVSFSVYKGEIFGLLGPNGAGKTTTFRMLCGLLPASRGSLKVAGVDVREARKAARRHVGYVAQKFSLYGTLSVRQNLEFFGGAYGLRGRELRKRIEAVLEDFSLREQADDMAGNLPGGYRQRLAMAAGLLHEPDILFLDEATSGADPIARREFWQRITSLASRGVTIIVTTHFMEEAEYCDRILIQAEGRALALDSPANIRMAACGRADATMEDAFIAIVEEGRRKEADNG